jgi:hypothetical protein
MPSENYGLLPAMRVIVGAAVAVRGILSLLMMV